MYENVPSWAWLAIILGGYLLIQVVFNGIRVLRGNRKANAIRTGFLATLISYLWLVIAVLTVSVAFGYQLPVDKPGIYPDILLIIFGFLLVFLVLLIDFYFRMVVKRKLGLQLFVDAEEALFLLPSTLGTWEIAFFNFAVLKPFAYELFLRGMMLPTIVEMTGAWSIGVSYLTAAAVTCVVEFLLKPAPDRVISTILVSVMLTIIFLASPGGIVAPIIVRVSASILLSLYFMHLVLRASSGEPTPRNNGE